MKILEKLLRAPHIVFFFSAINAVAADPEYTQKNQYISLKLFPRTQSQMAAFYEARGFPRQAIDEIRKHCFITVVIKNHSQETVWLELSNWRFGSERFNRAYWQKTWQALKVPLANQSTFSWTQLPESRDLRPDEPVGGNIVLHRTAETFSVYGKFKLGANKKKGEFELGLNEVKCGQDTN